MTSYNIYRGDCSGIKQLTEIKEEKVEIVYPDNKPCSSTETNTNDIDKSITAFKTYDKIVSSIEIVEELQEALVAINKSESEEGCAEDGREIKQEKGSQCVSESHTEESFKNQPFCLQDFKGPLRYESVHVTEKRHSENCNDASNDMMCSMLQDPFRTLQSDTENTEESPSLSYKEVESICYIKEENSEINKDLYPFAASSNNYQECEEASYPYLENISKNKELEPDIGMCNLLATTSNILCGSNSNSYEMETIGHPNKFEKYSQLNRKESTVEENTGTNVHLFKPRLCEGKLPSNYKKYTKVHRSENSYKCEICTYETSKKGYLEVHIRTHTGDKPFKCGICSYESSQRSNLNYHMRTHLGDKPYQCEICSFRSLGSTHLKYHMLTHRGKPYKCKICSYRYTRNSTLKSHMRSHTGETPFECEICSKKFSDRRNLISHLRTHTGDKPYQCNICSFKSSQSSPLKYHMRTHTGEKPFECEICSYKSNRSTYLKRHMRTHTEEKPFQCDMCLYKFTTSTNLKKYMRNHGGFKVE